MMLVCTTQGCVNDKEPDGPSLQVGDPLPSFSVVMNTGETVSTASLKGRVSVIVFFNTGCPDCQQELPVIQSLWDKYSDGKLVRIIPIAREESAAEIQQYWDDHRFTMPYSPQDNREVYSLFAPSVIPRVYVSDRYGIIRDIFTDSPVASFNTLESSISTCLGI